MDKFRTEVIQILSNPETANDISTFWLRKTKKPVLSVLLVEKNNRIKLYRGIFSLHLFIYLFISKY